MKISVTTFALCVFYLVWDWKKGRGDRWALWLEEWARSVSRFLKRRIVAESVCRAFRVYLPISSSIFLIYVPSLVSLYVVYLYFLGCVIV